MGFWYRNWNGWHTALAIIIVGVVASYSMAGRLPNNPRGVCRPANGHSTSLSVSSSDSTQLPKDSEFWIDCTVDVYCELADGSAPTADTNSQSYDAGGRFFGTVDREDPYLACVDQAGAGGTCRLIQCL